MTPDRSGFKTSRRWPRGCWLLVLGALSISLAACGNASSPPPSPTLIAIPPLPPLGTLPPGAADAQVLGPLAPTTRLHLTIGLATNRQALADDLAALYDPASPQYGQFLTPQQVAARYGAAPRAIDQVRAFLTAQGFQIEAVSALRDSLRVSATVAQLALAFHLVLQRFQQHGVTLIGPTGQVSLPPALRPLITSLIGLSTFAQVTPAFFPGTPLVTQASASSPGRQTVPAGCPAFQVSQVETPGQVAVAYRYADAYRAGDTGQGIRIGAIEFNDQVAPADLQTFLACTTTGTLHYRVRPVDGGTQTPEVAATGEAELDLEQLAALAPAAQVLEYQAPFCQDTGCFFLGEPTFVKALVDAMQQMASEGQVQVASVSWGGDEGGYTSDEAYAIDQAAQALAVEGVTLAASSGDCAAYGGRVYRRLAVQLPASDPYVLAVGGTLLQTDAAGQRTSEPAWSDMTADPRQCQNLWGSGGGLSTVSLQPGWQKGPGVKNAASTGWRQVPDVAAIAGLRVPEFDAALGGWFRSGGTSAAAPIWVAGLALVDQGLLQHHKQFVGASPTFYRIANHAGKLHPFYDVTQGDNLYYPATAGYDLASGWGAPNIVDFGKTLGAF